MNKTEAHAHLDRIREGYPVSLAIATQALQRTGDLCGASGKSLFADGNEPNNYRPRQIHDQSPKVRFSYSAYLNCPTIERTA